MIRIRLTRAYQDDVGMRPLVAVFLRTSTQSQRIAAIYRPDPDFVLVETTRPRALLRQIAEELRGGDA